MKSKTPRPPLRYAHNQPWRRATAYSHNTLTKSPQQYQEHPRGVRAIASLVTQIAGAAHCCAVLITAVLLASIGPGPIMAQCNDTGPFAC